MISQLGPLLKSERNKMTLFCSPVAAVTETARGLTSVHIKADVKGLQIYLCKTPNNFYGMILPALEAPTMLARKVETQPDPDLFQKINGRDRKS